MFRAAAGVTVPGTRCRNDGGAIIRPHICNATGRGKGMEPPRSPSLFANPYFRLLFGGSSVSAGLALTTLALLCLTRPSLRAIRLQSAPA